RMTLMELLLYLAALPSSKPLDEGQPLPGPVLCLRSCANLIISSPLERCHLRIILFLTRTCWGRWKEWIDCVCVCVCVCVCRGQGEKEHSLKQPGFQIGCHMDPVCCEVHRVVTSSLNTSNTQLV